MKILKLIQIMIFRIIKLLEYDFLNKYSIILAFYSILKETDTRYAIY